MNLYSVRIEPRAWKKLMALRTDLQEKILAAIENLELAPRPSGCKKLKDQGGIYRIRVGDYRVLYSIEDDALIVLVVDIGDRKEIY